MNIISIGDAIFIWDVLAWTTPRPDSVPPVRLALENEGQPRNPREPFKYTELTNNQTARAMTRSISNSETDKTTSIRPTEMKKPLTIPTSRRHFIQKINHSHLAKVILVSFRLSFLFDRCLFLETLCSTSSSRNTSFTIDSWL